MLDEPGDSTENEDPYFLPAPNNISVHEGDLAVLKCRIANLGPKMVNVVGYVLSCVSPYLLAKAVLCV